MRRTRSFPIFPAATLLVAGILAAAGCSKPPGYGSSDAVIAVVDTAISDAVEPVLRRAFEREVQTTRTETVFDVTFAPAQSIGEFRKWRRIVVVQPFGEGTLVDGLVDAADGPLVAEVHDEWARDQTIWVVAAPGGAATVDLLESVADSLYGVIHDRWAEEQTARMWASGRDSTLFRSLVDSLGFGIVVPRLYDAAPGSAPADSRVFYAGDPRRVVSLHWLDRPSALTADTVLAVRRAWAAEVFPEDSIVGALPGAARTDSAGTPADSAAAGGPPIRADRVELGGEDAVRLRGLWRGRDGTSAGPFVTWGVICGDRLVLVDGDLYAPDRKKYPYLVQMERIAATFACDRDPT